MRINNTNKLLKGYPVFTKQAPFFTEPLFFKKEKSDSVVASVSPSQTTLSSQTRVCKSCSSNRNDLVLPRGVEPLIPAWEASVLTTWPWEHVIKLILRTRSSLHDCTTISDNSQTTFLLIYNKSVEKKTVLMCFMKSVIGWLFRKLSLNSKPILNFQKSIE